MKAGTSLEHILIDILFGGLVVGLSGGLVVWWFGCLMVWLFGGLVVWSPKRPND